MQILSFNLIDDLDFLLSIILALDLSSNISGNIVAYPLFLSQNCLPGYNNTNPTFIKRTYDNITVDTKEWFILLANKTENRKQKKIIYHLRSDWAYYHEAGPINSNKHSFLLPVCWLLILISFPKYITNLYQHNNMFTEINNKSLMEFNKQVLMSLHY